MLTPKPVDGDPNALKPKKINVYDSNKSINKSLVQFTEKYKS